MEEKADSDNVRVAVRCRPMQDDEIAKNRKAVVSTDELRGEIKVVEEKKGAVGRTFYFDNVFGMESKQADIFNITARPILDFVLEGYNGTIFAYGQTGTGKTYTMEGVRTIPEERGITPNSFAHIFAHIAKCEGETQFLVHVSYLEIYNENIRDLLGKDTSFNLEVKERPDVGVYVKDLSSFVVKSPDQMDKLMTVGAKNRSVGETKMNKRSSRSHTIFTITVEQCCWGPDKKQHVRMGKLHLVDLAGSERLAKTGATGDRLKEAIKINLSLTTLGNVISALVEGTSSYVPYRNSKLTRLLQDSLGGNSKTVMIANIGPADYNMDETINTLRYADRAKSIKNKAKINEDPKDALLREFQKEIDSLKKKLAECEESESEEDEVGEDGTPRRKKDEHRAMTPNHVAIARAKLQAERTALMAKKDIAEEERNELVKELEAKENELQLAQTEYSKMEQQLQDLQGKVIVGGVNLLEKAEEQERLLEESARKLQERKKREEALRKKLMEKEAEKIEYEEKYATLQDEAAAKTAKLKDIWRQLQAANSELAEMRAEYQRENEEVLENIRQLAKEVKLYTLYINYFIPSEYQDVLRNHAIWHEETGEWHMRGIAYAGNNVKKPPTPDQPTRRVDGYNPSISYLSYSSLEDPSSGRTSRKPKSRSKMRIK